MENTHNLNNNDVLFVDKNTQGWVVIDATTFKVNEFMAALKSSVQGGNNPKQKLFEQGISCEVLRPGANWQKGKVRLRLEFYPDQPESPLDDIRQTLKQAEIS